MEIIGIFLHNILNMTVERKLAATLHQDTSQLVMYNLMECLFSNVTENIKVGSFFRGFRTLKFVSHGGNAALKQFDFKKKTRFLSKKVTCELELQQSIFHFFHMHLLGYQLLQHTKFQKLPVCFIRYINVLIVLKTETVSFQNFLCILLIGKFLMQYSYKTCVKCFQLYVCV
jgi:hypothetical protein